MQRRGRRGRGVREGGTRGRGRGRKAAVQNEHLHQNIENEAYDSGSDEFQDQIDEFIALPVDINTEIHQEDLVEEEEAA